MSLSKKVFTNTVAQIIGRIITTITGVITLKLITYNYGASVYGDYTFVVQYLTVFGIFVDMGLFTIGVREMSKQKDKMEFILSNLLTLRVITASIILGIGIIFAQISGYTEDVFVGIIIMTIATFLAYIESTLKTILQCKLEMEYQTIGFVTSRIVSVLYIYYTVLYHLPFYHLLLGGVYGSIINIIITYYFVSKHVNIKWGFNKIYLKEIVYKSLPYGIALILNVIYFRIGGLLLYHFQGSYALGIYGVPLKILDILTIIPPLFMNSVLPILSDYIHKKDTRVNSAIQKSWDFLYMTGLPIFIGSCFLAPYIINFISKKEFIVADLSLKILMLAMLFSYLNTLFGFILVAINKQKTLLWINLFNLVINIILNLLIVNTYSYNGIAVVSAISELLILIMTAYYTNKYYKYIINFINTIKITISSILMGVFLYLANNFFDLFNWKLLFIIITIAGIIYTALLILLKVINKSLIGYSK